MTSCKNLFEYLERKPGVLTANTANAGCLNNCEGSPEANSGVESVGKPPGKRVRMKQSSFEVNKKDGNLVWDFSATNKANVNSSPQKLEDNDESVRKRKRPVRQCVESLQVQKKSCDVEEREEDENGGSKGKKRSGCKGRRKDADSPYKQNEEDAAVDGNRVLTLENGGRGKGEKTLDSPSKQIDEVGVAIHSGKHQCMDCVGACNCSAYVQGLGDEALLGPSVECSLKILGKAGSKLSSPTLRKCFLKQLKLKSESPDSGVRNEKPANTETASENIPRRRKHAREAKVAKGYSSQYVSSKQGPSKRKGLLLENSEVDALIDGDGAKLSNVSFDLRLEAKQAAEENARLNAGKETHPFFMQKRSLQTRVANVSETQFEDNLQNLRFSEIVSAPSPPFHITQNEQVEVAALDWKGWEFEENNLWKQDSSKVLKETIQAIPEEGTKLFNSGGFSCFLNASKDSLDAKENFCLQDVRSLDELLEHAGDLDRKKKQIEKLFAYLEKRRKFAELTVPADPNKDFWNMLSLKDLEQRFISYHIHCSSGMNNLWTDKYQPETSNEVYGNSQPVTFLNDWLRCWHGRVFSSDKDRTKENDNSIQDEDWGCFQDGEETLSKDGEDGLKNILLLTGPIGCGKSAALYACAKEQGFDVIEVNASECRSGALVKQKFGEAMESHGLNQRAVEDIAGVDDHKLVLENSLSGKETREKVNARSKENKEKHVAAVSSGKNCQIFSEMEKHIYGMEERRWSQSRSKALILFEDVDMVFDEDRGFMGALLQIAETAKRPIVLTSNRRDPCLPRLLDRLTIQLELPSLEELVCHAFMICVVEGIVISPSLVEHVLRCCCRDLRKSMMLLQFWCQGKSVFGRASDGQVSQMYGSVPLELDAEHHIMPKLMPWSFPCKLSERINMDISKALDEVKKQESLAEGKMAEERAARDSLAAQFKKEQKKMNEAEKKAAMLKRLSSDDESLQIFRDFENEMDVISKVTQSSAPSLGRHLRHRRHAVVTSDSEDADCHETTTAISETQLQDPCREFPVELTSEPDDMTFSGSDVLESSLHCRGSRQEKEPTYAVFRRLKKIRDVDFLETSSLMDVSCVPESSVVPETVLNFDNECHVRSAHCGNMFGCVENSLSNICSPVGIIAELQNLECPNKVEEMIANLEDNILKSVDLVERPVHCEKNIDLMGNDDFTASQIGGASSDAGHLKSKGNVDDNKLDLSCCIGTESMKASAKHVKSNIFNRLHDGKCVTAVYKMLPLMDECSRVGFNIGSGEKSKQEYVGTGNPVQQAWLNMLDSCEDFKSLLGLGSKDALTAINLATKQTHLISSSDLLISSCGFDHSDFYLLKDHVPDSCSDERMEIASTLVQQGFYILGHNLSNGSNINLHKEMLTSSTDSIALGKLIMAQAHDGMVLTDEFSEIGPFAAEQYSKRQERETRLSDALDSLVPNKSFFMAKGFAFHEYTSFLGRISKLEEARLSRATTLKRRARGCHHYLSTGRYSMSPENIHLLAQHSNYGKASGRSNPNT